MLLQIYVSHFEYSFTMLPEDSDAVNGGPEMTVQTKQLQQRLGRDVIQNPVHLSPRHPELTRARPGGNEVMDTLYQSQKATIINLRA
jgi:hypothetical protein